MPLSSGARLGSYEIAHVLGTGGMGEVYRARDGKPVASVALKVVLDGFGADADRVARFEREAKVLAWINHATSPRWPAWKSGDGRHFLIVDRSRASAGRKAARVELSQSKRRCASPCGPPRRWRRRTSCRVVHRDLKADNVGMPPDNKVEVLDFGLAKAMEGRAARGGVADSST